MKDLVGLTQLTEVAFQRLQLVDHIAWDPDALAAAPLCLLPPLVKRLRWATNLVGNRQHGRPARRIFDLAIQYNPHRTGVNLGRQLIRYLAQKDSAYSKVGASGKCGAIQGHHMPHSEGDLTQLAWRLGPRPPPFAGTPVALDRSTFESCARNC